MPSIKKLKVNGIVYDVDASSDYENLDNLPSINNVILKGNKTTSDLGIEVPTKMTDLINDDNFVSDEDYVHTDNNYTTTEKNKLAELNNYDDTEIRTEIAGKQPAGNYLTEEADPTVANYIKAITQNDISNWNNKSDFSGSYNDASDKPSINGITLLGNKTAEELGITGSVCNLGMFSDYPQDNRLDLNKLTPGVYLLYRDTAYLHMKATYKNNEIVGAINETESSIDGLYFLIMAKTITDELRLRDFIGKIVSFRITEGSNSMIYEMSRSIAISREGDYIDTSTGTTLTIRPVTKENAQTITGEKTFSVLPKSTVVPTDDAHFVNKKYVDDNIIPENFVWSIGQSSFAYGSVHTTTEDLNLWNNILDANEKNDIILFIKFSDMYVFNISKNLLSNKINTTVTVESLNHDTHSDSRSGTDTFGLYGQTGKLSINFDGEGTIISVKTEYITSTKHGGIHVLETNVNYSPVYEPLYPGSPATKKYVDDAITAAISQITDGDEVSY